MKSIFPSLLLLLSFFTAYTQETAVVKGRLNGLVFSNVSLYIDEDPLTGARHEYDAILLDSGKFELQALLYVPTTAGLFVDDIFAAQVFLSPGATLTVNLDSTGLHFEGRGAGFKEWDRILVNDYLQKYSTSYAHSQGVDTADIDGLSAYLLELKERDRSLLKSQLAEFSLDSNEYTFFENRVNYALYTFLWSELLQKGYPIDSEAYQFLEKLPLDDVKAARSSLFYNRAISVYVYRKLRLERGWIEPNSFDTGSDEYDQAFYDQIFKEIDNEEVRNLTLNRKVVSLLSAGSTAAVPLFKQFLQDCSDPFYRNIAFQYYNDYLGIKGSAKEEIKIDELEGELFDVLKAHKGKVVYLDFWASWCGPCREAIPFTKKLKEKYQDWPFEVVYVNIDDNIGSFETAAKKLGINNNLIYMNKDQSREVRKLLKIQGIPHYTLINKEGTIVSADATRPETGAIERMLKEELEN